MRLSLRLAALALLVTLALAAAPATRAEVATGSGKAPATGTVADGLGDRLAALWDTMIRIVFGAGDGDGKPGGGDQTPGSEIDPNGRGVRGR